MFQYLGMPVYIPLYCASSPWILNSKVIFTLKIIQNVVKIFVYTF